MKSIHTLDEWRQLAGKRQGLINKLDKKVRRLEAELTTVKASCEAHTARLAMYDAREAA